ncbi:MAG: FAD-binding oxidoreductase [Deltaproteobacteria bacterium]
MGRNESVIEALKGIVGPEHLLVDPKGLSQYAVDDVQPWVAVFPESVEDISKIVRLAGKENLAIVPRGAGTKTGKGNPPSRLDMVVCTERLNRVVDMDTANLTVTAQAGVPFRELQAALRGADNRCYMPVEDTAVVSDPEICSDRENTGCFIPLFPPFSSKASLGGIIAANSSGPMRLLYGLPRDLVLGARFVTPDGDIIGMGGKTVKNVSGYDITKLMIGSQGSLGILCEMTLRLLPLPEKVNTEFLFFEGLREASDFTNRVFDSPLLPAAVELMNHGAFPFLPSGVMEKSGYGVAVAMEGVEEAVDRMAAEIKTTGSESGALKDVYFQAGEHYAFWDAYSNLEGVLWERNPDLLSLRLNYPVSRYAELMDSAESMSSENALDAVLLCHAGSGLSFAHIKGSSVQSNAPEPVVTFLKQLEERCDDLGGHMVMERARPFWKKQWPVWGKVRGDFAMMKRIKEQMDPLGLFSPGRFVGGI